MLRNMTAQDIPAVLSIIHETFRRDPHYNPQQQALLMSYATPVTMENAIRNYYAVVATNPDENDRVVGMGALDKTRIVYMYVDPLMQGKGIGHELYENLEAQAREQHMQRFPKSVISVYSTENAVSFYERQGFVEKERINHVANGQTIVRVRMEKIIQ